MTGSCPECGRTHEAASEFDHADCPCGAYLYFYSGKWTSERCPKCRGVMRFGGTVLKKAHCPVCEARLLWDYEGFWKLETQLCPACRADLPDIGDGFRDGAGRRCLSCGLDMEWCGTGRKWVLNA